MEALTSSPVASPGLYQLTLSVLGAIDTWAADPARSALSRLVEEADEDEVALIPHSIGAVLPLLAGTPDRLDLALAAITRFDLFEAATGLSVLVWQGNRQAVLAGAAMVSHPAVPESFRELVSAHRDDLTEAWEEDLFLTRLHVGNAPRTDSAQIDRMVRWLPAQASDSRFAAAGVQPPTNEFSPRDHLRLCIDLVSAGVVVRRLPDFVSRRDNWLPGWVPVVGPSASFERLTVRSPLAALDRQRIVERVFSVAPGWRARHASAPQERLAPLEVTSIEAFDDGAMPRREVAYLSGLRRRQFESLRHYDNLAPLRFRGLNYWTFGQLVGMRAAQYLFHISGRQRGLGAVADRLVRIARESQQVPVAITKTGEVLVKDAAALYDVETGQGVYEEVISLVDEVYEPFPLEGSMVPRLLRPSQYIAVHPGILRGLPHVSGTRVAIGSVAKALSSARHSHHQSPIEFTAGCFGIEPAQVRDAERIANSVNAAS